MEDKQYHVALTLIDPWGNTQTPTYNVFIKPDEIQEFKKGITTKINRFKATLSRLSTRTYEMIEYWGHNNGKQWTTEAKDSQYHFSLTLTDPWDNKATKDYVFTLDPKDIEDFKGKYLSAEKHLIFKGIFSSLYTFILDTIKDWGKKSVT